MTGSIAIDVALGLCFVFLLYSLLVTIIQEMITHWFGLRARMLLKAISRMLDEDTTPSYGRFFNYFMEAWKNFFYYFFNSFDGRPATEKFYNHPTIRFLGQNTWDKKPSYLSASIFATTIIDLLRGSDYDGTQDQMALIRTSISEHKLFAAKCETECQFKIFAAESKGDIDKFRAYIENWYDETMDRCKDWFKKQTQILLMMLGLGVAITFNVDAIGIVKILTNDPASRNQLVTLAATSRDKFNPENFNSDSSQTPASNEAREKAYKEVMTAINDSNSIMGLGWGSSCLLAVYQPNYASMIAGWIITALAISLGAPFWFDLLNKFMMLRGSQKTATKNEAGQVTITTIKRVG